MRDDPAMRTTPDIADEALQAAKEIVKPSRPARLRNGVPVLPRRAPGAKRPTMKLVEDLRDEG